MSIILQMNEMGDRIFRVIQSVTATHLILFLTLHVMEQDPGNVVTPGCGM